MGRYIETNIVFDDCCLWLILILIVNSNNVIINLISEESREVLRIEVTSGSTKG